MRMRWLMWRRLMPVLVRMMGLPLTCSLAVLYQNHNMLSFTDDEEQRVWHFPVSAIQTLEDGQQVIVVPTDNGHYSVPVPILPPGTSKLVVMATDVPDSPGELIYHVYVVSPLEAGES
ncbi:hypothetical protein GWK47_017424 [Chionoecetes opilio]|uniref:Uncharacterized protein n=1 Tax=Chionoecetes opilio TaxID=41210 RepID=A0A8J4XQX8_CHIOP|nr:hypothetical protein GWK47_017424 [Chionoecetes opilio]